MRRLLAALASVVISVAAAEAQTMSFATNPPGTVAYASGAAITKIYSEETGKQARVVPQGGPEAILPLLVSGDFDFAFANVVALNLAYRGEDTFPEPLEELRAVATVFPLRIGMFVREDSGVETVAGLQGKRIATEYPQQRNLASFTNTYLAAGGLTEGDYQPVLTPSGSRAVDDFTAGSVDAAVFSMTAGRMAEADVSVGGIRWLPMPETDSTQQAIDEHAPGSYVETLEPRPSIAGLDNPTPVLSVPFVIVTRADAPDEMVSDLAKVIHQRQEELAAAVPAFQDTAADRLALDVGVPYHPAALQYFGEAGVPVPQD